MGISLQDMIIRLSSYGVKFSNYGDNFVIEVKFPPEWTVIKPESENVAFSGDDNNQGVCYYMCPIKNNLSDVFEAINKTIKHNEELKMKVELFKQKVAELQELFVSEPYEKLKEIEFSFKDNKKKTAKSVKKTQIETPVLQKRKPKAKQDDIIQSVTTEHLSWKCPEGNDIIIPPQNTVETKKEIEINPSTAEASEIDKKIMEAMKNKKKKK